MMHFVFLAERHGGGMSFVYESQVEIIDVKE